MKVKSITQAIRPEFIIISLIVLFFGKNLFLIDGSFIGGIDVFEYFYWYETFIKEQILSGNIPLWNPYYYSGHPFLANPQTFLFYPSQIFYIFLSLPIAFNVDIVLHIIIAAIGTYYLAFTITGSKNAGIASSLIYSLNGYFMNKIGAGHLTMIHTAALIPWIFYFIEKAFQKENIFFLAISGIIFGLQILGGEPQNNFYTGLFCLLFFLLRFFIIKPSIPAEKRFRFGLYFLIIPVIAFGISAIQILPSLEFMSLSDRAERSYEFATAFSFPIQNLYTLLVPDIINVDKVLFWDASLPIRKLIRNWELGCYVGILSLILAGIGAAFYKHRRYSLCLGIIILISASMMFGQYTPIYYLYYKIIPGISLFRIPARCLVIFILSISILAGFGICYLSNSRLSKRKQILTTSCITILILCLFAGAIFFDTAIHTKKLIYALSIMIGSLIILHLNIFFKNKRLIIGIFLFTIFIDLYLIYSFQFPKLYSHKLIKPFEYESIFQEDPGLYRVNIPINSLRGMAFNYYGTNGYSPLVLNNYFTFIHSMADIPKFKSTRHTLSDSLFNSELVFSSKILGIKYAMVKNQSGYELLMAKNIIPRAVLVRNAVVLPKEEHIEYIKKPDFDPGNEVLLELIPKNHLLLASKQTDGPSNDTVTITKYEPNQITLSSFSNSSAYLVLSDNYYPGWRAYVDGNEVKILRANYLLRALPLLPGHHNIVFVYRPTSFIVGAIISIFTLLLLGVYFVIHCYRNKRNAE